MSASRSKKKLATMEPFIPTIPRITPLRRYGKWEHLDFVHSEYEVDVNEGSAVDLAPPCDFLQPYWGDVEDTSNVLLFNEPTVDYQPIMYDAKTVKFSDNQLVSHY